MIIYKVDPVSQADANSQIADMKKVVDEIYPTLEILQKLLHQHEASFSIPSINSYRSGLRQMIANAMVLSRAISEHTEKLTAASEQATKHLTTIDDHFSASLKGNFTQPGSTVQEKTRFGN